MSGRTALQVAGGVVGAVIGFYTPIGPVAGASLGATVGGLAGAVLYPPDPIHYRGPTLSDLRPLTSQYGTPIPWVWANKRLAGTVIWQTNLQAVENTERSGGKGGQEVTSTTTTYWAAFAVLLCQGPIYGVRRIWADGKLIYDVSVENTGATIGGNIPLKVYTGSADQQPDPTMEQWLGAGNVPGYRGRAYVVFEHLELGVFGNRIPNLNFEVVTDGASANAREFIWHDAPDAGDAVFYDDGLGAMRYNKWTDRLLFISAKQGTQPAGFPVAQDYTLGIARTDVTQYVDPASNFQGWMTIPSAPSDFTIERFEIARGLPRIVMSSNDGGTTWQNRVHIIDAVTGATHGTWDYSHFTGGSSARVDYIAMGPAEAWAQDGDISVQVPERAAVFLERAEVDRWSVFVRDIRSTTDDWTYIGRSTNEFGGVFDNGGALWWVEATGSGASDVVMLKKWNPATQAVQEFYLPELDALRVPSSYGAFSFALDTTNNRVWVRSLAIPSNAGNAYAKTVIFDPTGGTPLVLDVIDTPFGSGTALVNDVQQMFFSEHDGIMWMQVEGDGGAKVMRGFDVNSVTAAGKHDFGMHSVLYWPAAGRYGALYAMRRGYVSGVDGDDYYTVLERMTFGRITPGEVTVGDIVRDICVSAGLAEADIDVTELTDVTQGYEFHGPATAVAGIEPLMHIYNFECVESGGVLAFRKKGRAVARSLGPEEIGVGARFGEAPLLRLERIDDGDLPRQVEVGYLSIGSDYAVVTQASRRVTTGAADKVRLDFPAALEDDEALHVAERILYDKHVARMAGTITVGIKHADLEPTDVIEIDDGEFVHQVRIVKADLGGNGVVQLDVVYEDESVASATSGLSGVPAGAIGGQVIVSPAAGTVAVEIFEAPTLLYDRDAPEIWVAAHRTAPDDGWQLAVVQLSSDGGQTWGQQITLQTETLSGVATTVLAAGTPDVFDTINTVQVATVGPDLASITEAQALAGTGNVAMVGDEVLIYVNATDNGDGTWTLSKLLRGLKGTEWAMSGHAVGDRFVLLGAGLGRFELQAGDIGSDMVVRYAPPGSTSWLTDSLELAGRNLECWSPAHLGGGRAADGAVTITWSRRDRLASSTNEFLDLPMSEASEAYELVIYTDGTFGTVKRTVTGITSETYTYSAANQVTDFGSTQATVYVRVFQVSAVVGRGYPAQGAV